MPTIDVQQFEQGFIIHFGGEFTRINAYTLASTLVNIADAARAANAVLNPGYEIEIVVEALESGSFRAKVRALYRRAENLFSNQAVNAVVLGVIGNFIYQHTLAPDQSISVIVNTDEVVIEQGDTRILVPRNVHEATAQVETVPKFRRGVGGALRAITDDPEITTFGFDAAVPQPDRKPKPPVEIPRERFAKIPIELEEDFRPSREVIETTELAIVRAILERSRRRWEFVWHGVRIAAPVTDSSFFDDFIAHRITIAPGDILRVRLRLRQRRDEIIGIFVNEAYEVVEVIEHIPRVEFTGLQIEGMPDGLDELDDE